MMSSLVCCKAVITDHAVRVEEPGILVPSLVEDAELDIFPLTVVSDVTACG